MKLTTAGTMRRKSLLATPPRTTTASYSVVLHRELVGLVEVVEALDVAALRRDQFRRAAARAAARPRRRPPPRQANTGLASRVPPGLG